MARSRKKYAEAEPLLVQGCERRLKHKDKLPPRDMVLLRESLDRLVQLYDATGRKDEAARNSTP